MSSHFNQNHENPFKKSELDFGKLVQILIRRKYLLLTVIVLCLIGALTYNIVSKPVYESSVLLKKENPPKNPSKDEIKDILSYQSNTVIETELELVKTDEVLKKVINDLSLFLYITTIDRPDGKKGTINLNYVDYTPKYFKDKIGTGDHPKFSDIKLNKPDKNGNFFVEKRDDGEFNLLDADTKSLIETSFNKRFETELINFSIEWKNARAGKKIGIKVLSYYKTLEKLRKDIELSQKAKTDVFTISVRSETPTSAQILANSIAENYREIRIEQQKETIRYSYDFVDQNIEDIKEKLKQAEDELTEFKSTNQIMNLEGSSADLVHFLSNVETEKMSTELELTQYYNKMSKMKTELNSKGFFDQTYLSPTGTEQTNSPFSQLMKQLSDLELKRLDLLQKRTESHPEVINIDEQIRQVKAKLENFNKSTLTSYDIIVNSLEKKKDRLDNLSSKYQGKMQMLPAKENKLASLTRQRDVFAKMYTLLLDKREEMRLAELTKLQDITVADYAHLPLEPVTPRKVFNLAAALLIGIFLGFFLTFIIEARSKRLISLDDIEDEFNLPIFGIIPRYTKELDKRIEDSVVPEERFVTLIKDQDGYRETYRVLRTKISGDSEDRKQIIMFTSSEEDTGKTTVVANLAISIAQANKKVLVVDADLRKGSLSRLFDFKDDAPGLLTYLRGKIDLPHIYNRVADSLYILPSGGVDENSSDLLDSDRMAELIEYLNDSFYDFILFDTPPVNYVVDTLVLAKSVKDAVIIIRPGHTIKESFRFIITEMMQAKINIRGTVINAGDIEQSIYKYRYAYGYGYRYRYGQNSILNDKKKNSKTKSTSKL